MPRDPWPPVNAVNARKVLVFPAASEVGLEINEALRHCKEVEVHGAGVGGSTHGPFAFERFHEVPAIHQLGWLQRLQQVCVEQGIDYIFPAYDDVIVALAEVRDQLPAVVLTAALDVCLLTRSKRATYHRLASRIRVPRVHGDEPESFPVFVKPDRGQGSQGARRIDSAQALQEALRDQPDLLVTELLTGEEYTVDCFSDRERGVLFAKARIRNRTRNGIAVNTESVDLPQAMELARLIQAELALRGAWFYQIKRAASGEFALLEVAPRIAGSMSTHRVQGVNFPLLTIFEHERLPVRIMVNPGPVELDRALRNRYAHAIRYRALYIDLDDTLLLRGQVNLDAIRLVYQSRNQGARVVLITRHAGDLPRTLQQHGLQGVFDEVIHLTAREKKSAFIREPEAIFVDDSFAERADVHTVHGIPTFDCSMIELLIGCSAQLTPTPAP